MRKTIQEKIESKKFGRPNKLGYWATVNTIGRIALGGIKLEKDIRVDLKKWKKEQFILISNHASRIDCIFIMLAMGSTLPINFMSARNEFYRSHLALLFNVGRIIPKKNMCTDLLSIKAMNQVVKCGGSVCFFPEGISSVMGTQQPIVPGTGKFLKHYKLPVLISRVEGGFLANSKFDAAQRNGKVKIIIDELFTKEDLEKYTTEELDDIINERMRDDEFEWNKIHNSSYKCKKEGPAKGINQLMYRCPHCNKEFSIEVKKDFIECTNCGIKVHIDDKYNLSYSKDLFLPSTPNKWGEWERRMVRKEVMDPNFSYTERVRIGVLPKYNFIKKTEHSDYIGEGYLTIDRTGITYKGTKDNEEVTLHASSKDVYTVIMSTDMRFFFTYAFGGEYLDFEPLDNYTCLKQVLAIEEIHRVNGGKWKYYKDFDYENFTEGFKQGELEKEE